MESAAYEAGDICDNVIIGGLNMRIAAVICEYNPFHNGHKHQIDTARTELGCDGFIGLMSGNFVQRGEFAVFDKSVRAAAETHGGIVTLHWENEWFTLRVLLPQKNEL